MTIAPTTNATELVTLLMQRSVDAASAQAAYARVQVAALERQVERLEVGFVILAVAFLCLAVAFLGRRRTQHARSVRTAAHLQLESEEEASAVSI